MKLYSEAVYLDEIKKDDTFFEIEYGGWVKLKALADSKLEKREDSPDGGNYWNVPVELIDSSDGLEKDFTTELFVAEEYVRHGQICSKLYRKLE